MKRNFEYYNKARTKYQVFTVIGYFILGLSFILYIPSQTSGASPNLYPFVGFIIGGLTAAISYKGFKNLSNQFKNEYLPSEIRKIYPDCQFDAYTGFDRELLYETGVIRKSDKYFSEDMMYGTHEGVAFRSADVKLQEVRGSGKHRRVVTVFQGRVYEFAFNKRFRSNILVKQPDLFSGLSFRKIKLESIEFNSELCVYSDNEHEAFYILTPHFMERLMKLDKKYYDKINFSFINNKLYIAIDSREDTFDLTLFSPIDENILIEYSRQLKDINEFVHDLNLDNTLFIQSKDTY